MVDLRALVGIVIFSAIETAWIALVFASIGLTPSVENLALALVAFVVLVEEHIVAHNVGKGESFPRYFFPPKK